MTNLLNRILAFVRAEPVRVATWVAGLVVFLAAKLGVVVDSQSLIDSIVIILPVLFGGEFARTKVSPN